MIKWFKIQHQLLRAIIFDLDGTLYDFRPFLPTLQNIIIELVMKNKKLSKSEALKLLDKAVNTSNGDLSYSNFLLSHHISLTEFHQNLFERYNLDLITPNKKLVMAIEKINKYYVLALLTNTPITLARQILNRIGINAEYTFNTILSTAEMPKPKPDPNVFATACLKIGYSPQYCLMVGDRFNIDIAPSIKIGMSGLLCQGPDDVVIGLNQLMDKSINE